MLRSPDAPAQDQLVADLKLLREKGLPEIGELDLPALASAARIVLAPDESPDDLAPLIEVLVRRSVGRLGGGKFGDAAQTLFGLDGDTRTTTGGVRRDLAAKRLGVGVRTFRRTHEGPMLEQIAQQIGVLCAEQRQREGRGEMAAEHPVVSGMAVHWIDRFEAYYRIWSPITGIANDLTAYRSSLLEEPRPYDRRFGAGGPEDPGYSQEEQAEGYARFALYHYAAFEWELRRFGALHGGLWLLSEPDVESEVSDAVYRISWHVNPYNERDQSYLRTLIDETPGQEMHGFLQRLASTGLGRTTHQEWQEWCASCECVWSLGALAGELPVARNTQGVSEGCQVHQVIAACVDYCRLIDTDWRKIADWYHLAGDEVSRGKTAEELYAAWREPPGGAASRSNDWP